MRRKAITTALTALAITVLAAAGTVAAQTEQRFDDVPTDHYAFEAINWMVDAGITGGCGDGSNFCPNQPLNRAHLAAFLYRAIAQGLPNLSGLGDGDDNVVTDDITLEPGYYTVRVWFDEVPGFDWDDGKTRDFYVWFGSKNAGGQGLVDGAHSGTPFGFLELRVDEADDYWFSIRADDEFVWWTDLNRRPTPDGVTFD